MKSLPAFAVTRVSPLVAALVATTLSAAARADDAPTFTRSPHEATMTELGDQLEEVRLRAKVEDAEAILARRRNERSASPRFGSGRLGRGSLVFPDLLGISSLPVAGALGVGGILFTGPISFATTTSEGGSRASSIGVAPSLDFFVSDHVTIGGRVVAFRNTSTYVVPSAGGAAPASSSAAGYSIGIAPRVGYVVPLTDDIALWPQLGLLVTQSRFESEGLGRTLSRGIGAELEVGLLLPLGRHVVVRLAPTLAYNHASNEGASWSGASGDSETIAAGVRAQMGLSF